MAITSRVIRIIGVPMDLGQERRGVDMGPSALRYAGIHVITMHEIDKIGMASAIDLALDRLNHVVNLHVSLDMDALDPDEAPGVGTPVAGGLTYREAHLLMEILAESGKVMSLDIVEVNTILDKRNRTAQLGVELAASLFGQRIL